MPFADNNPLPTRHRVLCLETFQCKFGTLDIDKEEEKTIEAIRKKYGNGQQIRLVKIYWGIIRRLLLSAVSYTYLYDSYLEFYYKANADDNGYQVALNALLFQLARGYMQIEQGWRFSKLDTKECLNEPKFLTVANLNVATSKETRGFIDFGIDSLLGTNRTCAKWERLGIRKDIYRVFRTYTRNIVLAVAELIQGYREELCKKWRFGKYEEVCNKMENGHPIYRYGGSLMKTLPNNFGMARYDLVVKYFGKARNNRQMENFRKELGETPTLEQEAGTRANKEASLAKAQTAQQKATQTTKAKVNKRLRKSNGGNISDRRHGHVETGDLVDSDDESHLAAPVKKKKVFSDTSDDSDGDSDGHMKSKQQARKKNSEPKNVSKAKAAPQVKAASTKATVKAAPKAKSSVDDGDDDISDEEVPLGFFKNQYNKNKKNHQQKTRNKNESKTKKKESQSLKSHQTANKVNGKFNLFS